MYINAGNAAYSVSTAFTRLNEMKGSKSVSCVTKSKVWVDSLRAVPTNVLY